MRKGWIAWVMMCLLTATVSLADDSQWPGKMSLALTDNATEVSVMDNLPAATGPLSFKQGSWVAQSYMSGTIFSPHHMIEAHLGGGYFLMDNLSLNLELVGGYTSFESRDQANGGSTWQYGFDLLVRWHLLKGQDWSIYVDGGAGLRQATGDSFPAIGSHFNFMPQAGFGATYQITRSTSLMGGLRYVHLSNAGITSANPGYDGMQVYLGLMVGF